MRVFDPARLAAVLVSLVMVFGLAVPTAFAADKDKKASREREALRRVQQQLQVLQQEKSDLAQRETALAAELVTAKERAAALSSTIEKAESRSRSSDSESARVRRDLAIALADRDAARARLNEAEAKIAALNSSQTQTAQQLKTSQLAADQLKREGEKKEQGIQSCESKNRKLYELNVELLDRFNKKTSLDTFLQAEPFTQLKRVETENLLQEYRDKIDAERIGRMGSP